MDYSFPQYLLSKQSVDDRALNKDVLSALRSNLPPQPFRIIEVGAGIGTMLRRLIRWNVIQRVEYVLVDEMPENIEYALKWMNVWSGEAGLSMERSGQAQFRIFDNTHDIHVEFVHTDVFKFIQKNKAPADLLIANAFLDLLPLPDSLPHLLTLTQNLAWLTINFDGVTTFMPVIDPLLDKKIEQLYHVSMNERKTGGDSETGRKLFEYLKNAGAELIAAGASDWVVNPLGGKYPDDEKLFLKFILRFIEQSMRSDGEITEHQLRNWLGTRNTQIDNYELVYIAHQMDFLAHV